MVGSLPDQHVIVLAALYSAGAHGIMTLNDFKAVEGDRQMGIRSLPVMLGIDTAAQVACAVMVVPQMVVIGLLGVWGHPLYAVGVGILLIVQVSLMSTLIRDPREKAPWYNATGTTLYVLGMLVAAFAVK
jgi:chlorophyll synthase